MSTSSITAGFSSGRLVKYRERVESLREHARNLSDRGATGIQVTADLSEQTDELLLAIYEEAFCGLSLEVRKRVERHSAVIAVGGSGRGELSPYSDTDLLFLYEGKAANPFRECTAQMVRDCWDAGLKLGHSLRTVAESVSLSRQEPEIATALLEARWLCGSEELFKTFRRRFQRKVIRNRFRAFLDDCIEARQKERFQYGDSVRKLEPDTKRSLGGLRDIHLIRWIGGARFGTTDIESLRLSGALSREDARNLLSAQEFLMQVRNNLHFHAGRCQDVLTREDQLRITRERNVEPTTGQRPVERFMQVYFQHSTFIADLVQRFADLNRPRSIGSRIKGYITTRRVNRRYQIGNQNLEVIPRYLETVCGDLEQILGMYATSVLYQVSPTPRLSNKIRESILNGNGLISPQCYRLFLNILRFGNRRGEILRSMFNNGVLERVLPEMSHARCLLQFNQYHSYTVDEHTLRAVEAAERFEADSGPLGSAYRLIRHKEILHLALLLHDLGKGFEEDHSEVGREIAERVATRLELPAHHHETLTFLVHKHLKMAHLAFRRDLSDAGVLLEFAQEVGSPETLRMLYVLTAADLTAVGPGVWTDWKADLLSDLYDRAMLVLSGKHPRYQEEERLRRIKEHVRASIVPLESEDDPERMKDWIDRQLDALPPHYLSENSPSRIATDLSVVSRLNAEELVIDGRYDPETETVEYHIIASPELAEGCFHKTAGALSAKQLQILSAQISTSLEGVVIDSYRVVDRLLPADDPQERIDDIKESIRIALTSKTSVPQLFQRYMRFDSRSKNAPVSDLPMRVVVDNDSSERCTIIDVFAHDRPGLLYTITRSLYEMGLSVMLAKIATHLDQVVDVFYVTDTGNRKIRDGERLKSIREDLLAAIEEFEREGHQRFVS